jgi:hypothetical protein
MLRQIKHGIPRTCTAHQLPPLMWPCFAMAALHLSLNCFHAASNHPSHGSRDGLDIAPISTHMPARPRALPTLVF